MVGTEQGQVKGLREGRREDNVYCVSSSLPAEQTAEFRRFATTLAGQYELECEIGRGGMGIVYLARDLRLDRRVAIKTLPMHLASDSVVRERFLREARTAASLSHPNIVPIHRADEIDGQVFFVMGYVEGESLAQRVRDRGPLDPRDAVRTLRDVADALSYAHEHSVIHRDVKAENILIDRVSGRALVTDFGIARLAEAAPLTATGQILGTVYYLSPEQVSGDAIDARSDIYSLGVVGFFALTGRFPFEAPLASAVLIAHVNKSAPPVHVVAPRTPRALADIVDQCLAKDPAWRFQTCAELSAALTGANAEVQRVMSEVDASAPATATPLLSDTQAHDILARAADLQAVTGMVPRESTPILMRSSELDLSRTSGHKPADLRDAAVEAGIPAKYVDRALLEHGIGAAAPGTAGKLVDNSPPAGTFLGSPTRIDIEMVVEGEVPIDDFDLLVEIVRSAAGEAGELTIVGRSLSWQSNPRKGTTNVSVVPRNGKTRIRISESLVAAASGIFGGVAGGVGGASMPVWIGVAAHNGTPLFVFGWAATALTGYVGSRLIFRSHKGNREEKLRRLAERLAEQVRESIDVARPKQF